MSARLRSAAAAASAAFAAIFSSLMLAAITVYRYTLSPLLVALFGARCRFHPSCSVYAMECIRHEGPVRGSLRALARLSHCHPFHPGGLDEYQPPSQHPKTSV